MVEDGRDWNTVDGMCTVEVGRKNRLVDCGDRQKVVVVLTVVVGHQWQADNSCT